MLRFLLAQAAAPAAAVTATTDPAAPIADGLIRNPLAYICALLIIACVFLFKQLSDSRKEHLETVKAGAKDQREILTQIVPLTTKLTEGLEILERVTDKLTKG
jgi:hypothetical protein